MRILFLINQYNLESKCLFFNAQLSSLASKHITLDGMKVTGESVSNEWHSFRGSAESFRYLFCLGVG